MSVIGIEIITEDKECDGSVYMCIAEENEKKPCGEFATVNAEIISAIPNERISLVQWSVGDTETEELSQKWKVKNIQKYETLL